MFVAPDVDVGQRRVEGHALGEGTQTFTLNLVAHNYKPGTQGIGSVVYAGSKCCLSLDMCTAIAKPCEYARQWQMSR